MTLKAQTNRPIDDSVSSGYSSFGMDYVILEPHYAMDDNGGQPILYQSDLRFPNSIYVLKYNYKLADNIIIPEGCVLRFEGGSISGNYKLRGNNTYIDAGLNQIFSQSIIIEGTWKAPEAYPEWFGAKGNGLSNDRYAINKALVFFNNITFTGEKYLIDTNGDSSVFVISHPISIKGVFENCVIHFSNVSDKTVCFSFDSDFVNIENVFITGEKDIIKGFAIRHRSSLRGTYGRSLHLTNVKVWYFHDGIVANSYLNTFKWVECAHCVNGFYIGNAKGSDMTANTLICCYARDCSGMGFNFNKLIYSSLISCAADDCNTAYTVNESENLSFISCGSENNNKAFHIRSSFNIGIHNQRIYNAIELDESVYNKIIDIAGCWEITFFSLQRSVNNYNKNQKFVTVGNSAQKNIPCVRFAYCYDPNLSIYQAILNKSKVPNNVEFLSCGASVTNAPSPDIDSNAIGTWLYNTELNKPVYWDGNEWRSADGYKAVRTKGNKYNRPTELKPDDDGLDYYDTTLHKELHWDNRYGFVESDGVAAGTERSGLQRPDTKSLYVGFMFFDTKLNKPIYWTGDKSKGDNGWVDSMGNNPKDTAIKK